MLGAVDRGDAASARPMDTVIATEALTRRYGDVLAVDGLDLQVHRGDVYALVGLNGAGKTTTIRMLLGMIRPTHGTASLFGEPVHPGAHRAWSHVGYMVEMPHAYPELTVRQNLEVSRRLRHLPNRKAVDDVMGRLGLDGYADVRADRLSLGNRQRLGLARALIHRPGLLILDEPANALDPAGIVEIRHMLMELAHEHEVTVFISSHVLAEVSRMAQRVGVIHAGHLVTELDASSLHDRTRARLVVDARERTALRDVLTESGFAYLPTADGRLRIDHPRAVDRPDAIAGLLASKGVPPTHLVVEAPELEAVFLELVADHAEAPDEKQAAA